MTIKYEITVSDHISCDFTLNVEPMAATTVNNIANIATNVKLDWPVFSDSTRDSVFNAKSLTRIEAWNVRTFLQCRKVAQLLLEFNWYTVPEHIRGVGVVMSKKVGTALVGWKSVNDSQPDFAQTSRRSRSSKYMLHCQIDLLRPPS